MGSKLNQILKIIEERCDSKSTYEIKEFFEDSDMNDIGFKDNVNITLFESVGGYEGAGEDMYFVLKLEFKNHSEFDEDVYVRYSGFYDSWGGDEWQIVDLVTPKPKEAWDYTSYERKRL